MQGAATQAMMINDALSEYLGRSDERLNAETAAIWGLTTISLCFQSS